MWGDEDKLVLQLFASKNTEALNEAFTPAMVAEKLTSEIEISSSEVEKTGSEVDFRPFHLIFFSRVCGEMETPSDSRKSDVENGALNAENGALRSVASSSLCRALI